MGRRYYCDYCDKTFIDDIEARKKHLLSSHHIKLRNLHYHLCKDPEVILKEEIIKAPCRRFEEMGICQFAGNCKYTHYSQEELWDLKQQVDYREYCRRKKEEQVTDIPSVDSWLDKYNEKNVNKTDDNVRPFWNYPQHLEYRPDLPPSLKKLKEDQFYNDDFAEWGV